MHSMSLASSSHDVRGMHAFLFSVPARLPLDSKTMPLLSQPASSSPRSLRALSPLRRWGMVSLCSLLLACGGGGEDEGFACTLEVRPAVLVEPVDGQGRALTDVQISWRLNGGPSRSLACAAAPCAVYDLAGTYDLVASKPGHASANLRVSVVQGRCHLSTESWRPVLALL